MSLRDVILFALLVFVFGPSFSFIPVVQFLRVEAAPPLLGNQTVQTFNLTNATVQPIFSPDNSLDIFVNLLNSATTTLEITNQYITQFCTSNWTTDCSPVMAAIVAAKVRGVSVRVMLGTSDSDNAAGYLAAFGIPVCYLTTNLYNHNKGVIVDQKVVAVSSVNWSKQALTRNRESGAVVYDAGVAGYFLRMFDYDFLNNCNVQSAPQVPLPASVPIPAYTVPGPAHPPVVGDVVVRAFVNPDKGYAYAQLITDLKSVRRSLHITIYQTSTTTITNHVKDIKSNYPTADVSEVISYRRVEAEAYTPTNSRTLIENGVNIWNSSKSFPLTHAKYWTWDARYVTVYSGNWATTSFSSPSFSGVANRDWGLTFDSPCLYAAFDKVFQADRLNGTLFSTLSDPRPYDACGVAGGPGTNCPCTSTPSSPTATPTATSSPSPTGSGVADNSLGQGGTIGIAVGAGVAFVAIAALVAFFVIRKRRARLGGQFTTQSKMELVSPPPPLPQGTTASSLPSGWTEEFDPQSNQPYYHNQSTGATQWERPSHNIH